jgi:hypothetical protein
VIINGIRFLKENSQEWLGWRFANGTGIYRDFICLRGDEKTLNLVDDALEFAMSGNSSLNIIEASMQISDNGGDNWMIHRKGDIVNYLKNGAPTAAGEDQDFLEAILDIEGTEFQGDSIDLAFDRFQIVERSGAFIGVSSEQTDDPRIYMKQIVGDQITVLANECAKVSGIIEICHPKKLSQLARLVEPIIARFDDLKRQAKEVDLEIKTFKVKKIGSLESIGEEIDIIDRVKELAGPLLDPASTLKLKRSQLKTAEIKLNNLIDELDLDPRLKNIRVDDWRKPLESICRMEAYGKLVHASQGARKYCEQKIEPSYRSYISAIRKSLDKDRTVSSELESCLASLNLYCGVTPETEKGIKPKNWFEKFKNKQVEEGTEVLNQSQIDTIRMAIEYVLSRLTDMQRRALEAGEKHDSVQQKIDDSHEELVRSYGQLREHWFKVANQCGLPDDMNLNAIIKHVCAQSELVSLNAQREQLIVEIDSHRKKLKSLKIEIHKWREKTGSQKQTDLSTESIILTDARDILKFREVRRKQFREWHKAAAEVRACRFMKGMIKKKKISLDAAWEKAFEKLEIDMVPINAKFWPELIKRASLMRALALIHSSAGKSTAHEVFADNKTKCPATIYRLAGNVSSGSTRRFVEQLSTAASRSVQNLKIILVEDAKVFTALKDVGIGVGTAVKTSPKAVVEKPLEAAPEMAVPTKRPSASQLNDRAKAALDILTGGK